MGCVAGMEKQSLDLSQPLLFADLIATEYRCQRLWIVNQPIRESYSTRSSHASPAHGGAAGASVLADNAPVAVVKLNCPMKLPLPIYYPLG